MRHLRRQIALLAIILAAIALPASAQQRMTDQPGGGQRSGDFAAGPGPRGNRPTEEQREAVRKKMEAVRIARLTEELQLDEKTAIKFIPAITAIDLKRRAIFRENEQAVQQLRALLNAPQPDEGALKATIQKILKNRDEINALRLKEVDAARDHLTVKQQARYMLFNQEFRQEMRGMVEDARGGRTGRNPDGRKPGQGMAPGRGPGQGPGMGGSPPESK